MRNAKCEIHHIKHCKIIISSIVKNNWILRDAQDDAIKKGGPVPERSLERLNVKHHSEFAGR